MLFLSPNMYALLKKEIKVFLSSLIGYVVIIVFLLSLFMWVFPAETNVLRNGYANINPLFEIGPWVFLFLIPAITMRSFAEERKTGTIELLLTRPLTDMQIVFSKFLAGFILVIFSLLPTLVYYYSVHKLGYPAGNIDTGGMWGSYFGLLFLGGAFVAIGVFASSLSDNQIISFVMAVAFCAFCYIGFDNLSSLEFFGKSDSFLLSLSINTHYVSLSRGVIDTRDVIYFISLIAVFLFATRTVVESRKW
jgi:ABC-2 type transport system permease protein